MRVSLNTTLKNQSNINFKRALTPDEMADYKKTISEAIFLSEEKLIFMNLLQKKRLLLTKC